MEVKIIRMTEVQKRGNIKALVDVVVAPFEISGVKIVQSKKGLWVSLPQSRWKDGSHHDVLKFLSQYDKAEFQEKILKAYSDPLFNVRLGEIGIR